MRRMQIVVLRGMDVLRLAGVVIVVAEVLRAAAPRRLKLTNPASLVVTQG